MTKILVTGALGQIGSELTAALKKIYGEKTDQRREIENALDKQGRQSRARTDSSVAHRQPHWTHDFAGSTDQKNRRETDRRRRK